MIKTILFSVIGLLVLAIAVMWVIAAQRPDTFRVQRTASIAAPPDKLFPLINDVRAFNSWSPYVLRDPQATGRYSGPPAGPGARYDFDGTKSGSGSFEITAGHAPIAGAHASGHDGKPFEVHNAVTFTLVPQGNCHPGHLGHGRPGAVPVEVHGRPFRHGQDGGRRL
jgi:hypothetical protein